MFFKWWCLMCAELPPKPSVRLWDAVRHLGEGGGSSTDWIPAWTGVSAGESCDRGKCCRGGLLRWWKHLQEELQAWPWIWLTGAYFTVVKDWKSSPAENWMSRAENSLHSTDTHVSIDGSLYLVCILCPHKMLFYVEQFFFLFLPHQLQLKRVQDWSGAGYVGILLTSWWEFS